MITVVIPVFNGSNYVAEAIDSALAQTWPHVEILVVNDGSTDGGRTASICHQYEGKIRYYEKENGGVSTALNFAIERMQGEYFSWLSHDDLYMPNRLENMIRAIQRVPRTVVAYSDFEVINDSGQLRRQMRRQHDLLSCPTMLALFLNNINGCTVLVPKTCFESAGLFHPGLTTTQDSDMWFRLSQHFEFLHVPENTVSLRSHKDQASHSPFHSSEVSLLRVSKVDDIMENTALRGQYGPVELLRLLLTAPHPSTRQGVNEYLEQKLCRFVTMRNTSIVLGAGWSEESYDRLRRNLVGMGEQIVEFLWPTSAPETPSVEDAGYTAVKHESPSHTSVGTLSGTISMCAEAKGDLVWLLPEPLPMPRSLFTKMFRMLALNPKSTACLVDFVRNDDTVHPVLGPLAFGLFERRTLQSALASLDDISLDGMAHAISRLTDIQLVRYDAHGLIHRLLRRNLDYTWQTNRRLAASSDNWGSAFIATGSTNELKMEQSSLMDFESVQAKRCVLLVASNISSSSLRLARDLATQLSRSLQPLILVANKNCRFSIEQPDTDGVSLVRSRHVAPRDILRKLRDWNIERMVLLDHSAFHSHISRILDTVEAPFDIVHLHHDFVVSEYDVADANGYSVALAKIPKPGHGDIRSRLCEQAARHYVCSNYLAERLAELGITSKLHVLAPPDVARLSDFRPWARPPDPHTGIRISLFGDMTVRHGAQSLFSMLAEMAAESLPCQFELYGSIRSRAPRKISRNLRVYKNMNYLETTHAVCRFNPHFAWFPLRGPEGFVYGIRDAVTRGVPVVATDTGSAREQLAGRDLTWIVPLRQTTRDLLHLFRKLYSANLESHRAPIDPLKPANPEHDALSNAIIGSSRT